MIRKLPGKTGHGLRFPKVCTGRGLRYLVLTSALPVPSVQPNLVVLPAWCFPFGVGLLSRFQACGLTPPVCRGLTFLWWCPGGVRLGLHLLGSPSWRLSLGVAPKRGPVVLFASKGLGPFLFPAGCGLPIDLPPRCPASYCSQRFPLDLFRLSWRSYAGLSVSLFSLPSGQSLNQVCPSGFQ